MSKRVRPRRTWFDFVVYTLNHAIFLSVSLMIVYTHNPTITYDLSNWIMWHIRH
jgi:hypothetical protein